MRETNKARQAFEDYFALGPGRSLTTLLLQYQAAAKPIPPTRNITTIKVWSTNHNWQERVAKREAEIALAQYDAIKEKAVNAGYAFWPKRVEELQRLADLLQEELYTEDKRWLPDVKQIGSGEYAERVDLVRFNSALIEQFRRTLDDIASELGERTKALPIEHTGEIAVTFKVQYGNPDDRADGQTKRPPLLAAPDTE